MAGETDLHERLVDDLEARLAAHPQNPEERTPAQQRMVALLEADLATVREHWRTGKADGDARVSAHGDPVRSAACDQPQPCFHVLALARQYRLIPLAD